MIKNINNKMVYDTTLVISKTKDSDNSTLSTDDTKKTNPSYYHGNKTADYISEFNLDFDLGNVVKYISRAGNKDNETALDDLKKAKWYIEHAISKRESK